MKKEKLIDYIDKYIKHVIDFSFFGNKFSAEIVRLKNKCIEDIYNIIENSGAFYTKKLSDLARRRINERLNVLEGDINAYIEEQALIVFQQEKEWLTGPISDYLDTKLKVKDSDLDKLLLAPVAYAGIVGGFGKNLVNKYRSLFFDMVSASYVTGATFEELKKDFNVRKKAIDRGVIAESETMGTALGSQFDRIVFLENRSVIKGYIWSSILDVSTCLVCGHLDGKIFYDITKVPLYPVHPRCRCILIPFTESIKEYLPESYAVWFEQQSKDVKKVILGKNRFQLYEKGMKIKDFVNNGQKTPLSQLKKKN